MATWTAYIGAGVTWVVWMVAFVVLDTLWHHLEPLARDLAGNTMSAPISWMDTVMANWILLGVVGIFIALIAAGIVNRGVPA